MKNRALILGFGVIFAGLFSACCMGNMNVVSQERTAEGFDSISLVGVGNVNVYPGENYKVIVTTDSNLQHKVVTTVNGNTLHLTERKSSFNSTELTIDVYMPELKSVSLSGAGNFYIKSGDTDNLNISLSGTGNIDARRFKVQNITITHSGVGNTKIWATGTLKGHLSGVGNILYKGSPTINIDRSGVGNIRPL